MNWIDVYIHTAYIYSITVENDSSSGDISTTQQLNIMQYGETITYQRQHVNNTHARPYLCTYKYLTLNCKRQFKRR